MKDYRLLHQYLRDIANPARHDQFVMYSLSQQDLCCELMGVVDVLTFCFQRKIGFVLNDRAWIESGRGAWNNLFTSLGQCHIARFHAPFPFPKNCRIGLGETPVKNSCSGKNIYWRISRLFGNKWCWTYAGIGLKGPLESVFAESAAEGGDALMSLIAKTVVRPTVQFETEVNVMQSRITRSIAQAQKNKNSDFHLSDVSAFGCLFALEGINQDVYDQEACKQLRAWLHA